MDFRRRKLMATVLMCALGVVLSFTDHRHSTAQPGNDAPEKFEDVHLVREKSFIWMTGHVQPLTAEILSNVYARRHLNELVRVEIFPIWRKDLGPKGGNFSESPTWRFEKGSEGGSNEAVSKKLGEKLERLDKALNDAIEAASWEKCTDLMSLLDWDNTSVRALARLRFSLTDPDSETDYSRGLFEGEVELFWYWPPNEGKNVPKKEMRVGLFSLGDAGRVLAFTERHSTQLLGVLGEMALSDS